MKLQSRPCSQRLAYKEMLRSAVAGRRMNLLRLGLLIHWAAIRRTDIAPPSTMLTAYFVTCAL